MSRHFFVSNTLLCVNQSIPVRHSDIVSPPKYAVLSVVFIDLEKVSSSNVSSHPRWMPPESCLNKRKKCSCILIKQCHGCFKHQLKFIVKYYNSHHAVLGDFCAATWQLLQPFSHVQSSKGHDKIIVSETRLQNCSWKEHTFPGHYFPAIFNWL